ncbi:hypothetical protein BC834DRAFT_238385 [Gloeopeniophorella convolvens]|nr:hypothetical protein BC834DRAFT_238385 [Gloeopeniophorella convolvens]
MSMQSSGSLEENMALEASLSLPVAILSPFRNPLCETSRAAILKEINTTELRLRSLYAQLNALAPVSLLPAELLTRIFHLLRDDRCYNKDTRLPFWITVTHVCRHWREVALSDSTLWSGIWDNFPMCTEKWLVEMLIRSKEALLDVDLRKPSAELLRSVAFHPSHIRSLVLNCLTGSPSNESVQKLLMSEAPELEELYLGPKSLITSPPIVLLNDLPASSGFRLFRGQAPKLRSIHLYQIHIPWAYLPRCTLSHLSITSSSDGVEFSPLGEIGALIDVLENSPTLERLTLDHCLAPVSSQPRAVSIVNLPRLSQLTLSGHSSSVLCLLESFHTPALLELRLLFVATNSVEVESWPTIAPSALARFYRTRPVIFNHLRIEVNHYFDWPMAEVNVEGRSSFATPIVPSSATHNTFVSLEFEDRSHAEADSSRGIISGVCAALRTAELASIYVTIPGYVDGPPFWTQLFRKCASVTELRASGDGTVPLLQSLKPQGPPSPASPGIRQEDSEESRDSLDAPNPSFQDADTPGPAPVLLCPNLTVLSIDRLDFQYRQSAEEPDYDLIFELVGRRKHCDAPIQKLRISKCVVSSTQAASLAALVPTFHWDRNEDSELDSDGD